MMRTEIARSSPATLANGLNFGWVRNASRTGCGGFVHSTPAYNPSVFWRKTTTSTLGSSKPPAGFLRMKLSGLPGNDRHGRMHTSRLKIRSEEHTSELQSLRHLVCRLLLEKKKEHI